MSRITVTGVLLALGAGLVLWAGRALPDTSLPAAAATSASSLLTLPLSREIQREKELEFYQRRILADPFNAGDYATLARLYLERARATGNYEDVLRTESAARRSLELRKAHNAAAYLVLTYSLLDQHRFEAAFDAARQLVLLDPQPAHHALLGETQMELGRYDEAAATFRAVEWARADLAVGPRLARWEEVAGRPDRARSLLHKARDLASARVDLTPEQLVVFHFRVGEFNLRNGYLDGADEAFQAGLAVRPGDYRIIAQQAKLEALRHNWQRAIELGSLALEQALEPATLGLLADAYGALGDRAQELDYTRAMEVAVQDQKRAFHREWSHFLLDHGLQLEQVRQAAVRDLGERADVYGYDLLAWALYKQMKYPEAKTAMAKALQLGTQDAALHFHAGMIEVALGNRDAGTEQLEIALKLNDQWHHQQPQRARAVLDSLKRF